MKISLKVDDSGWRAFFDEITSALKNSDTIFKKALLIVWPRDAAQHFDREEGWNGPWAPWKEATRRQRISHEIRTATATGRRQAKSEGTRAGGKLLQMSGRLRTQTVLDPEMRYVPGGIEVLSPTPYSGFLDEGTKNMEARPFMWLGDDAMDSLSKIFLEELGEKFGGTD